MGNISNRELIDKYNDVQSETTRVFKEIFSRYIRKEMSESEYEDVRNISIRNMSYLFDTFFSGSNLSNDEITRTVSEAIEIINDKNR